MRVRIHQFHYRYLLSHLEPHENEEDSFVYVVAKTPLTQTVTSFEEFFFFSFARKSSQSHFTQGFVSLQFLDGCGAFVSPALEIMGMC
jgi:hypothetical protein